MAYIGNKPANKAVVASDLDPAVITGQTALATSPADTDEFLISDAGVLKRLDASLIGCANTPAFEAYVNSRQNISDNTDTKVAFDTEVFDTGGQYDNSTNYRFTPTTSGKYFVYANIGMGSGDNSAFGTGNINIRKNGSDYVKGRFDNSSNKVNSMYKNISSVISMNGSGDYVEIFINVNTTSGTPFAEGNNNHVKASLFGAFKIIE